mgnify:CR=1 FL=1
MGGDHGLLVDGVDNAKGKRTVGLKVKGCGSGERVPGGAGDRSEDAVKRESSGANSSNMNDLVKALANLDRREIMPMEVYDFDSGSDFNQYLVDFQAFCEDNLKPNR